MEHNIWWEGLLELVLGKVKWRLSADKNGFVTDLQLASRHEGNDYEIRLMFLSPTSRAATGINYKGPGAKELFEQLSKDHKV